MNPKVLLCMPRASNSVDFDAAMAFFNSSAVDSPLDVLNNSPCTTALCCTFNIGWAIALERYERGECDFFAMQHDDVRPCVGYLDELHADLIASGADVLSAVVPIKDHRGLSSTAVDDTGDPWHPRRLTFKQLRKLPEIIYDEDVGGPLLLNTGCWMVRLGPWALEENLDGTFKFRFDTDNKIYRDPRTGKIRVGFIPEDWDASRQFRAAGLKLAASRRLVVGHYGGMNWSSGDVWGWEHDEQNAPQEAVNGNGQHDTPVAALQGA